MISKYDGAAAIESLKAARSRKHRAHYQPSHQVEDVAVRPEPAAKSAVNEADIRLEMERRLAKRLLRHAS